MLGRRLHSRRLRVQDRLGGGRFGVGPLVRLMAYTSVLVLCMVLLAPRVRGAAPAPLRSVRTETLVAPPEPEPAAASPAPAQERPRRGRTVLTLVGKGLAWLVILASLLALCGGVVAPRVGGATAYTVLSGSMEPDLPQGTLVVIKPASMSDIGIGDVITYQIESGAPEVTTHRVVAVGEHPEFGRILQTKGDANRTPDRDWVREEQVKGKLWYSVRHLGFVNTAISGGQRQWVTYLFVAGLAGYAAFMFVSALRERRRSRPAARGSAEPSVATEKEERWSASLIDS